MYILTFFTFVRIFEMSGPLSKYLQTSCMDLFKSQELVNDALNSLIAIQQDCDCVQLIANNFIQ